MSARLRGAVAAHAADAAAAASTAALPSAELASATEVSTVSVAGLRISMRFPLVAGTHASPISRSVGMAKGPAWPSVVVQVKLSVVMMSLVRKVRRI